MSLQNLIRQLSIADEQLEELLTSRLKFQPQIKCHFTIIVNKDLKLLYMSAMGYRVLGLSTIDKKRQMIGAVFDDFLPLEEKVKEIFNTGTVTDYTGLTIKQYHFKCLFNPIYTAGGDIEAVMCSFSDIPEAKPKAAAANQAVEIGQFIELWPMSIVIVDKDGKIISVNEAFIKEFAIKQGDILGKHYGVMSDYTGIAREQSVITKALNGRETAPQVISLSDRTCILSATPLRDPTGGIWGAIIVNFDITEYEKSRTENQEKQQQLLNQYLTQNRQLNQLIDLCPLGIVLYDSTGKVIQINRAHSTCITNFRQEHFLDKPGAILLEALGFTWEASPCSQALKGQETLDYYTKSKYGKSYLINAIPLRDYQNTIIGAMAIIHDITEYEQLKEDMTKLDRLNLVGEMAAGVAHEIRNPMTVIKGYLQFLSKRIVENAEEQFGVVLSELERVEAIITDFLSLAGNKIVENKEQDLNAVIKAIVPLIATDAMERGIDLKINLAQELPNLILNEKEIKQLLLNLARNGIDAMGQSGTLTIKSSSKGNNVSLCVEDTGCGISPENQKKIFDPFFTTKEKGTGLGLSVCAGIVRRNNGIIKLESEEGMGTRFIITFKVCAK